MFFYTLIGLIVAIAAICIWIMTFEPNANGEYSLFLFPISRSVLYLTHPETTIPVTYWYVGALLNWVLPGGAFDLFRYLRNR